MAMRKSTRDAYAPWIVLVSFFLLWEVLCRALNVHETVLPTPSAIVRAISDRSILETVLVHSWHTFLRTILGFGIGVFVGVVLGFVIGSSRFMYNAFYPLMIGFNAIPKAAIVPILVVWFGAGTLPAVVTAFLMCFFPVTVNVATGLATLEPELEDVLRSLGATRLDILLKVGLPRSLPYFFASLKIAVTLAFVGAIISEISASNEGIGYLVLSAGSSMRMGLSFAGLLLISIMAVAMYGLFAALENRMTGWATRGMQAGN